MRVVACGGFGATPAATDDDFAYAGEKVENGALAIFGIAGEDRTWVLANAVIDGTTVVVSSPNVANPVAVRSGYCNDPDKCNLYNTDGLPASPFRTDNSWKCGEDPSVGGLPVCVYAPCR